MNTECSKSNGRKLYITDLLWTGHPPLIYNLYTLKALFATVKCNFLKKTQVAIQKKYFNYNSKNRT